MATAVTLAQPYAKALFELASAKKRLDAWLSVLEQLTELVHNPKIADLIAHPLVTPEQVVDVLKGALAKAASKEVTNFLKVLAEFKRFHLLPEITQVYHQKLLASRAEVDCVVSSAYALSKAGQGKLETALKAHLGQNVRMQYEVDQALIGGVKVQAGDLVIDGSLKGKLTRLIQETIR